MLLISFTPGCQLEKSFDLRPAYADSEQLRSLIANNWIRLGLELTQQTPGFSAPVAARALAYSSLALYEAVAPGGEKRHSLQGRLSDFPQGTLPAIGDPLDYDWEIVANAAMAAVFRGLYRHAGPQILAAINDLEARTFDRISAKTPPLVRDGSAAHGRAVGEIIYRYATQDGQDDGPLNNFPGNFTPENGPGKWRPQGAGPAHALLPAWGAVRPFLTENVKETQPPAPPAFSKSPNSPLYKQALEVQQLVRQLTPEQEQTARYWQDEPEQSPTLPGHFFSILLQILELQGASLAEAAEAYVRLGLALHDACVASWSGIYHHNLLRPETFLRENVDPAFTAPLAAPPYPEYPSVHAALAGAAAVVLSESFGYQFPFSDRTHAARKDIDGAVRNYPSFEFMAEEAAYAGLYGGIQFRVSIEAGLQQGLQIGRKVSLLGMGE